MNGWHFDNLLEAQVLIEDWRIDYNTNRPHSAHGDLTPSEFASMDHPKPTSTRITLGPLNGDPSVKCVPVTCERRDDHRSVSAERSGENISHFCLAFEPTDLDAFRLFPDARKAEGLFGAQGFATSLYVKDPDGNTVELRSYP